MPEMTRRRVDSLQSDRDVVKYTISYLALKKIEKENVKENVMT